MNSSYISTLSSLVAIIGAGLPAVAFLLVWAKTGSLHLPLNRLWQLILGAQEIEDPAIKKLVSEQNDLMRFRLAFGVNVGSMAQCRSLQEWTQKHSLEMGEVGACRSFFDLEAFRPNVPPQSWAKVRCVVLLVALSVLVPVPLLMTYDTALVKLKESGRWFLLDVEGARTFSPLDAPRLTAATCLRGTGVEPVDSFEPREREILCNALMADGGERAKEAKASSQLAVFVQGALRSQRLGLALLGAAAVLCAVLCAKWLRAFYAARKLASKLEPPGVEGGPDRTTLTAAAE